MMYFFTGVNPLFQTGMFQCLLFMSVLHHANMGFGTRYHKFGNYTIVTPPNDSCKYNILMRFGEITLDAISKFAFKIFDKTGIKDFDKKNSKIIIEIFLKVVRIDDLCSW